jgi:phosphogluconate dehydratase
VVPLLARVYPNGYADVNQFHQAGGMAFLIDQLLGAGLLHGDVQTIFGSGMHGYAQLPSLDENGALRWTPVPKQSGNRGVLRTMDEPFRADGGLRMLEGNLGRAVIKVSSVPQDRMLIEAPAIVFEDQDEVAGAFKRGELDRDFVAVVRFQGPRANGMPELHKLTPQLGVLQDRGFKVALVTDGRMSGASGKVPAAIHVTPEAIESGPLARLRTGDMVRLDVVAGVLEANVAPEIWDARELVQPDLSTNDHGLGRELFAHIRRQITGAEAGASMLGDLAA